MARITVKASVLNSLKACAPRLPTRRGSTGGMPRIRLARATAHRTRPRLSQQTGDQIGNYASALLKIDAR